MSDAAPSRTLAGLVRDAASRALGNRLGDRVLRDGTIGLGLATAAILAAVVARASLALEAPLGDEVAILALAAAAAAVLAALALALRRALAGAPSRLAVAFAIDRALGGAGGFPAALELEDRPEPLARLAVAQALEQARSLDLSRVFPWRAPREAHAAPVLALAAGALAATLAAQRCPDPRPPFGPAALAPVSSAARAEEASRVREAARTLATRGHELARRAAALPAVAGQLDAARTSARELLRLARELEAIAPRRDAALARIAGARGTVEGLRSPGLGEALARAAAELARSEALRDLARAVDDAEVVKIPERGRELAGRAGGLDPAAAQSLREAAARAAQTLEGTQGTNDARRSLERLASAFDPDAKPDERRKSERASAANDAASALAKVAARAAQDRVAARAQDALEDARQQASGKDAGRGGEKDATADAGGAGKSDPRKNGAEEKRPGSSTAHAPTGTTKPGEEGAGGGGDSGAKTGKQAPDPGSGRGSVAGKGGEEAEGAPKARPRDDGARSPEEARLAGILGSRGASVVTAARAVARGRAATRAGAVLQDYRRSEEEALERSALPLDRRRLVRRYFETLVRAQEAGTP